MCGIKLIELIDKKNNNDFMQMLVVTIPIKIMIKATPVRLYGHILRKNKADILKALNIEVVGKRESERPKATRKNMLKL